MAVNPFRKKDQTPVRSPRITEQNESLTFRRSRTLTGSSSEQIRTAGEERAQIRSPRLKEHELRSRRRRLGGYLLGALLVSGGILVLLSQFIGILNVNFNSSQPLMKAPNTARYSQLINEYFAAHPVERFRFALDRNALHNYMQKKAPEIATVSITANGLVTANADIRFRAPVVAWQLPSGRSYVDGDGYSFAENYYTEPAVTVKDDSGIDPASGAIVSDRFLQFMGRVIALSNDSGVVRITGATIPRNTTREIDLHLEGRGYVVKTQLGRDPASQAMDIINAVKYVDSKGYKPAYLDVRVAGKAAYR